MKTQGWAVVGPDGNPIVFGLDEGDAWSNACYSEMASREELKADGYRCVPVTIEWRE